MEDKVLKIKNTTATQKIFNLKKRIRAVSGGTGASKTISVLIWCIDYAQSTTNEIISIVSESYPHLKKGSILDFQLIMKDRGYWKDKNWNKTDHQYTFETGTIIEFFSPDTQGKAHGPRRDILFANECNNLQYAVVQQLMLRTKKFVWLDWNPSFEFWYYTELEGKRDDIDFLHLTYLDNEAIDEGTLAEIMAMKDNKYLWQVYGLGLLGEAEGKIYKNWKIVEEIPFEARLERYGLDFGYTNDPTTIIGLYSYNGGFILDEVAWQKGLSNKQIADILNSIEKAPVRADSSEPKSIDEIKSFGITILGSRKGAGSVSQGIQFVQSQKISVTSRSTHLIKDYRNYLWKVDRDGKITNEPNHNFSHTMDAARYALEDFKPNKPQVIQRTFHDKTIEIWNGR